MPALARHATQTLAVSARVSPSAVVGFEISAEPLEITSDDLDRGYVDVVMKSRMQVTTPSGRDARPPIVMSVEPRSDLFRTMSVASPANGNGNGHSKAANGNGNGNGHSTVTVDVPADKDATQIAASQTAEFRYRFEFSKAAREGPYETAISVAIDL